MVSVKIKKSLFFLIIGIFIGSITTNYTTSIENFIAVTAGFPIIINGQGFKPDKPVVVINGSTYMPLKMIGDALNVKVVWNNELRRLEIGENKNLPLKLISLADLPEIKVEEIIPSDKEDIDKLTNYQKKELLFTADSRQELYDRIKKEIENRRTNFIICSGSSSTSGFTDYGTKEGEFETDDIVDNMLKQIFHEDPYLAAITNYRYEWSGGEVDFSCSYLETLTQTAYVKAKTKQILENIIQPQMTDLDKEKVINQWICDNIDYDKFGDKKSAYQALQSPYTAVCTGYAELAYQMLTQAGLKCEIVSGKAIGNSLFASSHMWNKVELDGKIYHLDITWNDTSKKTLDYFNKTDAEMKSSHSW